MHTPPGNKSINPTLNTWSVLPYLNLVWENHLRFPMVGTGQSGLRANKVLRAN